jgi:hypothetical protein
MQQRPLLCRHLQEQHKPHVQMQLSPCGVDTSRSSTYFCSTDTYRFSSDPLGVDTCRSSKGLCNADMFRCSSGPCGVHTYRSSTCLCSADMSRCSLCLCGSSKRCSTYLCSADMFRCSSGPCDVDTSRSTKGLCNVDTFINSKGSSGNTVSCGANGKDIEKGSKVKQSESFENEIFFDIDAKGTCR